jgi:hypothetical protein
VQAESLEVVGRDHLGGHRLGSALQHDSRNEARGGDREGRGGSPEKLLVGVAEGRLRQVGERILVRNTQRPEQGCVEDREDRHRDRDAQSRGKRGDGRHRGPLRDASRGQPEVEREDLEVTNGRGRCGEAARQRQRPFSEPPQREPGQLVPVAPGRGSRATLAPHTEVEVSEILLRLV